MEQLIKPPSKRGRPETKLEDLVKVTKSISDNDAKKKKIAKNNVASKKYRSKKGDERKKLDYELKMELAKFKELKAIHDCLETRIRQLKLIISSN